MTDTTAASTQATTLMGPKVLLEGPSGVGKTHSLGTLVDWAAAQTPAPRSSVSSPRTGLSPSSDTGVTTGRKSRPTSTGTSP